MDTIHRLQKSKSMQKLLHYIYPYLSKVALNISANILSIVFSLVSLAMIAPFLEVLFDQKEVMLVRPDWELSVNWLKAYFNYFISSIIVQEGKSQALLYICIVVVIVFFLKNLFRYLAAYVMAGIRNGVVRDIRTRVFQQIMVLPLSYFSEERRGDIVARVTSDVQEIEWSIMNVIDAIFREPLTIIGHLLVMLFISPQLTLFVFIILPITGWIIGTIGKQLKKQSHRVQEQLALLLSVLDESIWGLRIIKSFTAEQHQRQKFGAINQTHFDIANSLLRRKDLSSPLSEFLSVSVVVFVLYFGGSMVLNNSIDLSASEFIAFMAIFSQILTPAKAFSRAFFNIQKGLASVERVHAIIDAPVTIREATNPQALSVFNQNIQFQQVSFSYSEQPVLKNINFTLNKGKTIALVGASGAGKSTLADLIPRFYEVSSGKILLDGIDIKQYSLKGLRHLIGIVTQQAILFNDTVWNNLTLGLAEQPTKAAVLAAVKVANAYDFIQQLPLGFQTNIGDGGNKLSGGERQRLTIARAVLKNPPILILDEATASLDSKAEKLVQDALFKLMQSRTCLIIAHRLSTIQSADEILVMEKGEIVEQGTHQELMKGMGVYHQFVHLQRIGS